MVLGYGYSIGDLLNIWADMGVFAYLLPFLMIFALVYGMLTKTHVLGENRGVNATIALAFGLLALQFDYVSGFYASLFPYAGMGLAVFLVVAIFLGMTKEGGRGGTLWMVVGGAILFFVLLSSVSDIFWLGGTAIGLMNALPAIIVIGAVVGVMIWITRS